MKFTKKKWYEKQYFICITWYGDANITGYSWALISCGIFKNVDKVLNQFIDEKQLEFPDCKPIITAFNIIF